MEHSNESTPPRQLSEVDEQLQREIAEALGHQSVEDLMAEAQEQDAQGAESTAAEEAKPDRPGPVRAQAGASGAGLQVRRGRVQAVQGDSVFVQLHGVDGKNTGVVPLAQFERPPRGGAIMDFVVQRFDESEGLYILSREGAIGEATWEQLLAGSAVEARVTKHNKGGLELELGGGIRGFMPASQIDLHHVDDLEQFVGQKVQAAVQEVDRKRKRVVLSRRKYLEQARDRARDEIWSKIEEGQVVDGKVSSIADYGVFVDLGGLDGMVHISDMSHARIEKPGDMVKVGDEVRVKVLKLDEERKRVRLGMKQVAPDPWANIEQKYSVGDQITGRVARIVDFGAFIELEPGLEALLPAAEMSWSRHTRPEDVVKPDENIRASILNIDPKKKRIGLSLKQVGGDPWVGAEHRFPRHAIVQGKVLSTTEFGAFVEIEPGIEGLVHISELAQRRVNSVEEILKPGDTDKFRVLEVNEETRKIKLSRKAVDVPEEKLEDHGQAQAKPEVKAKPRRPTGSLKGGLGNIGGIGLGDLGKLKL
ncbi:MAG: S1 RNA-binding domain-containing protein [Phycisphaeraceae bacterium]|nr:S1 RNA-binding domain-containing protein [Phycisphaeraceae bacterium]